MGLRQQCRYTKHWEAGQLEESLLDLTVISHLQQPKDPNYYLLSNEGQLEATLNLEEHDYEEPYFEPASEEDDLLQQLKKLYIPVIEQGKALQ